MGAPTIKDVAALAGVSLGTASRVLTGHPSTSARSRERVTAAAARLGYTVNARARSLRAARSDVVALLVPDVRNTFFAQLAHTVQTALFARGLTTLISSASEDAEQQDRYLRVLLEQRIDGVILAPQGDATPGLHALIERRTPLVFVDRTITELDVPSIDSDPAPGMRSAVEELVAHGHSSVTYVAGLLGSPTGRERLAAFERAAAPLLAQGSARVIRADNTDTGPRRSSSGPPPTPSSRSATFRTRDAGSAAMPQSSATTTSRSSTSCFRGSRSSPSTRRARPRAPSR